MKRLLTVAALICVAAPAALAAPATQDSASKACKAQRNAIGQDAFVLLHAAGKTPKAAMDACLSAQAQLVTAEAKNAAKACKEERGTSAATKSAFDTKYGKNGNKKNAFGKCVSKAVQASG